MTGKEANAGVTLTFFDSGLVAGSTTTLTLGAVGPYSILGKAYTQSAVSNVQPSIVDLTTGANLAGIAPGYGALILIGATSSESTTLRMIQGAAIPLNANSAAYTAGDFIEVPQFPPMPNDFTIYGYVVVKVATDYTDGSTYAFGTSNTTATGAANSAATAHTNTFVAATSLPPRPQTS